MELDSSWRRLFAYVPQSNLLISGTIREVVCFGNGGSSEDPEQIRNALRVACAEEVDAGMPLCVIHGDLHYRNVFFRGDAVMHFLDFEKMRRGYPTEDLLRFFLHAMERTRFWRLGRMHRLEQCLAAIVRQSGYSRQAWLAALDVYVTGKRAKRKGKSIFPAVKAFESVLRAPLYRRVREIIRKEAAD